MSAFTRGLMVQFCKQIDAEAMAKAQVIDDIIQSKRLDGVIFSCAAMSPLHGGVLGVVEGDWLYFFLDLNVDPSTFDGVGQ